MEAGFRIGTDVEAYEPVGCQRCHGIGYRGRLGIYSVMVLSERIKDMVVNLAPEGEIAKAAIEEGMLTLRQSGLEKVRTGLTSVPGGLARSQLDRDPSFGVKRVRRTDDWRRTWKRLRQPGNSTSQTSSRGWPSSGPPTSTSPRATRRPCACGVRS